MRASSRIHLVAVFVCSLLLPSCAMNQAKRDFSYFRGSTKAFDTFEVDVSVEEAHRLVEEGARNCYAQEAARGLAPVAGIMVPTLGAAVTVESEPFTTGTMTGMSTRVGAGNSINYVPMFQVDIAQLQQKSKVVIYYEFRDQKSNGRQFGDVVAWVAGDTEHCTKRRK